MALTTNDLQAIGKAVRPIVRDEVSGVETRLRKEIRGVREAVKAGFAAQNQFMARSFTDVKDVMQQTYVNREEFEEKYTELQNEVDDLRKEVNALKRRIVPS
jgi:vacuolar-type H+-ATPase subunit D/Vma8